MSLIDTTGYKKDGDLASDIENILKFGKINKITGEFEFVKCKTCNGPLFGHIETEDGCVNKTRAKKFKDDEAKILMDYFRNLTCFKYKMLTIDTRTSQTHCDACNENMANRMEFIMHMESTHKAKVGDNRVNDSIDSVGSGSELANVLTQQTDILAKLLETTSKSKSLPNTTQITKAKPPPIWIGQTFERFKAEIEDWSCHNKDSEYNKYNDLIESLKKNEKVKGYVITVVIDRTANSTSKTIKAILEVLAEKYAKTKDEKCNDIIEKIVGFTTDKSESCEKFLDKFESLMAEISREKIHVCFNYVMSLLMIRRAYEGGKITSDEKTRLKEVIEHGAERNPVDEENVTTKLKLEFKKLKIENNRDSISDISLNSSSTFYTDNRSRYQEWKRFKESPSFNRYRRSTSNPGFWRTESGNYRRGPSRTPSRSSSRKSFRSSLRTRDDSARKFDRSSSNFRSQSEKKVDERLKNLEEGNAKLIKEMEELKELIKKANNVRFVAEESKEIIIDHTMDVHFTKEVDEVEAMIVDTGCPKTLVGREWLDRYLCVNDIRKEDLESKFCSQDFRFGNGPVFNSAEIISLPVAWKEKDVEDGYVKMVVETYVIDTKNIPFLFGKNTLKEWNVDIMHDNVMVINLHKSKRFQLYDTEGGHQALQLYKCGKWTTNETVFFMKKEKDVQSYKKVKRIHEVTNHKGEEQLIWAYRNANMLNDEIRKTIKKVIINCKVCQKFKRSLGRPKVAIPRVTDFNQIVAIDLKQTKSKYILWMVCSFTRFISGVVLPNKRMETVVEALNNGWNWRFGFPSVGFWADNGGEFQNEELNEYASKFGFTVKFGPPYSPWSNGLNERNHHSADVTVNKMLEADKKIDLKMAVNMAAWTHNTNVNILGYEPMRLVTGKSVIFPGISTGNLATESLFDSEAVSKIMERHHEITKKFREEEYENKLIKASEVRKGSFNDMKYEEGDLVFYQEKNNKSWCGPVKVFCHRNRDVFIWANGDLKKVADCKVQPYRVYDRKDDDKEELNNIVSDMVKEKGKKQDAFFEEKDEVKNECRRKTRSHSRKVEFIGEEDEERKNHNEVSNFMEEREEKKKYNNEIIDFVEKKDDTTGAYWLKSEKTECFDLDNTVFVVELPVKYHKIPEVIEAKDKEYKNLTDYDTFEEVKDNGQQRISSRWVITKKEKHDGQKTDYKARLVARGFQEECKPQADSPTVMKESVKVFLAVAANEKFNLQSIDIRAAFLQSRTLDRDVFIEPPKDLKKVGVLWKLKKPLYGLDDASRKFWLRIKDIFKQEGLRNASGDEAFYYKHDGNNLVGMVITHVDDFSIAGTKKFIDDLTEKVQGTLTVSKVEKDGFRFTGIDIQNTNDGIVISMEDYASSIEEMQDIRKAKPEDPLTKQELKVYRKYAGKISWLATNTRPDLSVTALLMSMKNNGAKIRDLKHVNHIVKRIHSKPNKVVFTKVGNKEDLVIFGIGDASYRPADKSIGGNLILLGSKSTYNAVPIFWKSKTIRKVCHSSKAAETRNLYKLADDAVFFATQLGQLLFGKAIKDSMALSVGLFTDSKTLLDSISSTKQVEERLLRNTITDLKEKLEDNSVEFYSWLETKEVIADILTKECKDHPEVHNIFLENKFCHARSEKNLVSYVNGEIRMRNHVMSKNC